MNAEYRKAFVEAHAKDSIAFQLRMMRKAMQWDQKQLAEHAFGDPKLQSMVSRYENPDYGKYSLNTLLELAAAFDVALVVHFAPFSELATWDETPVEKRLVPKSFEQELKAGSLLSGKRTRKKSTERTSEQDIFSGPIQKQFAFGAEIIEFPKAGTSQKDIGGDLAGVSSGQGVA
jgi:transcriptional regulator with XRE-family HTH domain